MNKLMIIALVAGGLMLVNSPEAAAHKEVRKHYDSPAYAKPYRQVTTKRSDHMPRWLRRDRSFRNWYQHSRVKRDRRLAWEQIFDIYRWERRWGKSYYRSDNYWVDYYHSRGESRSHDRDHRKSRKRRGH